MTLLDKLKAYKGLQYKLLYCDYFNNFLTISCFAEYYSITESTANRIINLGRKLNNK